ncbi:hypothetical protein [Paenibacillus sp. IHBB 3054]|uniref:hypothetical protein n=1 Tax=Paenibacillus sp. IHBB 3054 TaxID=3425689 RepID=UPI003F66E043
MNYRAFGNREDESRLIERIRESADFIPELSIVAVEDETVIGHPSYYPKFGFTPARAFGLELKQFEVPDEVFQVYELQEGQLGDIKGELRYPEAFF